MPKIRKKTSKRGSTRMREKVKHKVKEAHKKAKKEAKKDVTWKSRVKKDIGIPNLFPYKEQVLQEQQQIKELKLAEKQNQRLIDSSASSSAAALAASIDHQADGMEVDAVDSDEGIDLPADPSLSSSSSLRAHAKSLRKVLMLSDVLLEVLDARDPLGTRSIQLEKDAVRQGKKVLLILNKVDLVPRENVESWLKYLRRSWPTLPFKSSTQTQRNHLSSKGANADSSKGVDGSSNASSTQPLMHLLKNYARYTTTSSNSTSGPSTAPSVKSLASITVGVIGFPNVGKSSLINTLKRSKACGVAPTPGYTKDVQEIALEKGLKVLDCPGVVVDSPGDDPNAAAARVLRNAVKVEQVADPLGPIGIILQRCKAEHMMLIYNIPAFTYPGQTEDDRTREFLIHVARSRGRVKKGGIPDIIGTARSVLRDWNAGRIPYYTMPPTLPDTPSLSGVHGTTLTTRSDGSDVGSATILNQYGVEFDFEALFAKVDSDILGASQTQRDIGAVVRMQNTETGETDGQIKLLGEIGVADEDEDMNESIPSHKRIADEMIIETVSLPPKKSKSKQVSFQEAPSGPAVVGTGQAAQLARMGILGVGENKQIAKQARKDKKKKAKMLTSSTRPEVPNGSQEDEEMRASGSAEPKDEDETMGEGQEQPYSFADFFQGTNAVAKVL